MHVQLTSSKRSIISASGHGCSSGSEATNERSSHVSDGMYSDVISEWMVPPADSDLLSPDSDTSNLVFLSSNKVRFGAIFIYISGRQAGMAYVVERHPGGHYSSSHWTVGSEGLPY